MIMKRPEVSVVVLDATVPASLIRTEALGTAAPRPSETVPVSDCAWATTAKDRQRSTKEINRTYPFYHSKAVYKVV